MGGLDTKTNSLGNFSQFLNNETILEQDSTLDQPLCEETSSFTKHKMTDDEDNYGSLTIEPPMREAYLVSPVLAHRNSYQEGWNRKKAQFGKVDSKLRDEVENGRNSLE